MDAPPTFVVGTGRCGSTLVSAVLRAHPDILSVSEFFTVLGREAAFHPDVLDGPGFWAHVSTPREEAMALLRAGVQVLEVLFPPDALGDPRWAEGVPPLLLVPLPHLTEDAESLHAQVGQFARARAPGPLRDHYTALVAWLCQRLGKRLWVERSGGSLLYLTEILRFWPDARFVHIYRDGRDCAYSMSRHPYFRLMLAGPDGMNRLTTRRELPQVPVHRFGLFWSIQILRGMARLNALPRDRVLHVRYEDLLVNPVEVVTKIFCFVLPDIDPQPWAREAARLVRHNASKWSALPEHERERLNFACRPGLRLLGYE